MLLQTQNLFVHFKEIIVFYTVESANGAVNVSPNPKLEVVTKRKAL